MDFTIALKKREVEHAEALQARLLLQDISLYESEAAGAGPPVEAVEPVRLSAEIDSEVHHNDSSGMNLAVTLRVACDEELTFHVEATFLVRYRFADKAKPASKVELEAFRKGHAVLAVWPYLREFVQTITARMGFPTEPLPLLRLVSFEEGKTRSQVNPAPKLPA
jgi:preprotein translocase subunit SecB